MGEPLDSIQVIDEGVHAQSIGRPRDSCPYPADSAERRAWLQGYDGTPSEDGPDIPMTEA